MVAKGDRCGGGTEQEAGVSRNKLSTEWINNKVLPQSTGSCVQCPVINRMEKKMERYTGVTESLQCTAE